MLQLFCLSDHRRHLEAVRPERGGPGHFQGEQPASGLRPPVRLLRRRLRTSPLTPLQLGCLKCLCVYWNVNTPLFYKRSQEDILVSG